MSNKLARGMGSFFKPCECRMPSSCPRLHTIRFRNTRGKQAEGSGFPTQDAAVERLTQLCTARKTTPRSLAEQQETLGEIPFEEYAKAWLARERGLTGSTRTATESRMRTSTSRTQVISRPPKKPTHGTGPSCTQRLLLPRTSRPSWPAER